MAYFVNMRQDYYSYVCEQHYQSVYQKIYDAFSKLISYSDVQFCWELLQYYFSYSA